MPECLDGGFVGLDTSKDCESRGALNPRCKRLKWRLGQSARAHRESRLELGAGVAVNPRRFKGLRLRCVPLVR